MRLLKIYNTTAGSTEKERKEVLREVLRRVRVHNFQLSSIGRNIFFEQRARYRNVFGFGKMPFNPSSLTFLKFQNKVSRILWLLFILKL